jgi:hypothetical protein
MLEKVSQIEALLLVEDPVDTAKEKKESTSLPCG